MYAGKPEGRTGMTRHTRLLLGTAFVAGIAAGPCIGTIGRLVGGPGWITAAVAQDAGNGNTFQLLDMFAKVFERVRADYVEPVKDQDLINNALNGMLAGLDPHSSYMDPKEFADMQITTRGAFGGLGLEVTEDSGFMKVISPIDDTPAARAGIKPGDLITALDGQTVQGLTLNDAVARMRGEPGSHIKLTIKRDKIDTPIEVSMTREVIHVQVVRSRLEGDVGYIRLEQFNEETESGMTKAYNELQAKAGGKLKGIVLDLRNDPGGLLDQAISVSDDFIDHGEIVSTRARHPEDSQRWDAKPGDITNGLPLVVLINNGSASASEIVAGALQDDRRAALLGERSFGKGSVQTVIPLGNGGAIRLTTARYYTPSGRSIQGLGVTPDITVAETRTDPAHFGPERESDLNNTIANSGGAPAEVGPPVRNDLPEGVKDIPKLPPAGFPAFDPAKSSTDFQLQEALVVVHEMAGMKKVSAN
jgi:carboxyl-terminal processing protease